MPRRRAPVAAVLVLLAAAVAVPLAGVPVGGAIAAAQTAPAATPTLDRAAAALRTDPVYVDPAAPRAPTPAEADDLRDRIVDEGLALYLAVLPAEAAAEVPGGAGALPQALGEAIGLTGTVAVVVGDMFRAGSSALPAGEAGRLATEAFVAERDAGTAAVLHAFVDRVAAAEGGAAVDGGASAVGGEDDGGGGGLPSWILPAALVGGGAWWLSRRRRANAERAVQRRRVTADVEALRASARLLGEDVYALEPHVAIVPDARADYEAALSRYRFVESVLPHVDTDEEVARTQRVLDEGHYAMARARARAEGREPALPADLARPGTHAEPALQLDERGEPAYADRGDAFYGAGGGWYGGGNGLLTGLLLGQVLGGGWGWGHMGGWGGGGGDGGGDDEGRFGGDWGGGGGGDWGGGGGGDWGGGGDVGGGDW